MKKEKFYIGYKKTSAENRTIRFWKYYYNEESEAEKKARELTMKNPDYKVWVIPKNIMIMC